MEEVYEISKSQSPDDKPEVYKQHWLHASVVLTSEPEWFTIVRIALRACPLMNGASLILSQRPTTIIA